MTVDGSPRNDELYIAAELKICRDCPILERYTLIERYRKNLKDCIPRQNQFYKSCWGHWEN